MGKSKIIFTKETIGFIIEALGWYADNLDNNFVKEKNTNEYILDVSLT